MTRRVRGRRSDILSRKVEDEHIRDVGSGNPARGLHQGVPQSPDPRRFGEAAIEPAGVRMVEKDAQQGIAQARLKTARRIHLRGRNVEGD